MMNANTQFGSLQPQEHPAVDCQMTEPIVPTVTINLNSTFTGTPEQLAEMQAQLEQLQLNRAGTFALEFQQMAQSNGLGVNMQFNIHNTYDLADDSAERHFRSQIPIGSSAIVDTDFSEE